MRKVCGDDICLWADGTWCYYSELEEMGHMSDDFEIVPIEDPRHDDLVNN